MTTTQQPVTQAQTDAPWMEEPGEKVTKVSVLDILLVLARQRKLILGTALVFGLVTLVFVLLKPKTYEASVTILPPAQMTTRAIGGSIQDLSLALSSAAGSPFKSSEDFWTTVMKGRTITQRVVETQNLKQEYHTSLTSAAQNQLLSNTSFDADKAGLITITVKDTDPNRAAAIANAYIEAVHREMATMAVDDARQRKAFFDQQVDEERANVDKAEDDLMQVERKTGVIELGAQTSQAITQIADLRSRITLLNVQLQAMREAATDQNPEVQRIKAEISGDQAALAQAESEQGRGTIGVIGAKDVPQDTLEYIRATRDLRYHQSLYEALVKQVEAARMDEARSAPMVQIVDSAIPPDHPAGFGRSVTVILGFLLGFMVGIGLGLLRHFYWTLEQSPEGKEKMQQLIATLKGHA
jgi:uncharacterized protein involved in exopolysaccharide biosynthesis